MDMSRCTFIMKNFFVYVIIDMIYTFPSKKPVEQKMKTVSL